MKDSEVRAAAATGTDESLTLLCHGHSTRRLRGAAASLSASDAGPGQVRGHGDHVITGRGGGRGGRRRPRRSLASGPRLPT
eukprot:217505-Rhodomonas_salina.1